MQDPFNIKIPILESLPTDTLENVNELITPFVEPGTQIPHHILVATHKIAQVSGNIFNDPTIARFIQDNAPLNQRLVPPPNTPKDPTIYTTEEILASPALLEKVKRHEIIIPDDFLRTVSENIAKAQMYKKVQDGEITLDSESKTPKANRERKKANIKKLLAQNPTNPKDML
jgi:hypothetical protein